MSHSNGLIDSSELNPSPIPTFSTTGDGVNGGSHELNPPTLPTFSTVPDGANGGSYELNPPTLPPSSTVHDGSPDSEHSNLDDHKKNPSDTTTKKSRGRPKGSKNKPKAPIVITKDKEPNTKTVMLEIPPGSDVVGNIINFAREKHVGVSIMSASGAVSRVTLRPPSSSHAVPLVYNNGPFVLLSLSGSFVAGSPSSTFSVTLAHAGGQPGQVFGGIICGEITAATTVVVVAVTFELAITSLYKLPLQGGGGGGGGNGDRQTNPCPFNNQSSRVLWPIPTWSLPMNGH